jgi:hypothetical protein
VLTESQSQLVTYLQSTFSFQVGNTPPQCNVSYALDHFVPTHCKHCFRQKLRQNCVQYVTLRKLILKMPGITVEPIVDNREEEDNGDVEDVELPEAEAAEETPEDVGPLDTGRRE